ncbi:MAG: hypothetical protein ACYCT1_08285 [Steroidobacteraceae bacterium]
MIELPNGIRAEVTVAADITPEQMETLRQVLGKAVDELLPRQSRAPQEGAGQ